MFKKVEDDLILGISKVISKPKVEKSNLLINEDITDDLVNDIEDLTKKGNNNIDAIDEKTYETKSDANKEKEVINEKDENLSESTVENEEEDLDSSENTEENSQIKVEKSVGNDKLNNEDFKYRDELFESLKGQIDYLKEQISIKDQQLQNKDELIRNFQVLMKHDKDRILLLENKIKEEQVEEPVESIDSSVKQTVETPKKSGFFSWFKK